MSQSAGASDPRQATDGGFNAPSSIQEVGVGVGVVRAFSAMRGLPFVTRYVPWLATTGVFVAPKIATNAQGLLTNGAYRLSAARMVPHLSGSLAGGKSQFLFNVNANRAVLDAAAFADKAGLWAGNTAKVFVQNGPVGALGRSGNLTNWINVYRTRAGLVHGAPGNPP